MNKPEEKLAELIYNKLALLFATEVDPDTRRALGIALLNDLLTSRDTYWKKRIDAEKADWLRSGIEKFEREMKKEIVQSGGGGIDTEHWYYKGILFSVPGIKQILSYGVRNESWWTLHLLKHNIFVPLKLKQEGRIEALTSIITRYKEELKELTGE